MFRFEGGRPGDARGFVHKSFIGRAIGGAARRFISATPVGQAVSFVASTVRPPARPVAPRTTTARPSLVGAQGKEFGRELKFGGDGAPARPTFRPTPAAASRSGTLPCLPGFKRDLGGKCRWVGFGVSEEEERMLGVPTEVGDAVMGRYGAALEPGSKIINRAVCLRGMTLGDDGLCYNKGAISNKERMWPRGRRPLLTGGDMRAIGIAARAGSKLDRTTKRLRSMGMMKALPKPRAAPKHLHAKPVTAVSVT